MSEHGVPIGPEPAHTRVGCALRSTSGGPVGLVLGGLRAALH